MLITALFTIARTWKQPKYPLTEKLIKKKKNVVQTHYSILLSYKGEQNYVICTNMNGPRDYLTE